MKIGKRTFRLLASLALGVFFVVAQSLGADVQAQKLSGQIVFGGAGGTPGKMFREDFIPAFEKETGVKVVYVTGTLQQHFARITAQPDNPEFDAVWSTFSTHNRGKAAGVFAALDEASVPNLKDIYPQFRDSVGVASSNSAVGIEFNTEAFAKAGIPKPQSWSDLWDPRLKGRVGVWTVASTYGSTMIPFIAQLYGSGEDDYATAFAKLKELAGGDTPLLTAPAALEPLISQGTIWVTQNSDARTFQAIRKGLPVEFVVPKEGAIGLQNYFDVLAKAKNPDAARGFVNHLISAQSQTTFANRLAIGPTNSMVKLDADVSARVLDSTEEMKTLFIPDYTKLIANLPQITKEFNAQIAR